MSLSQLRDADVVSIEQCGLLLEQLPPTTDPLESELLIDLRSNFCPIRMLSKGRMLGRQANTTPTLVSTTFHMPNGTRLPGRI